MFLSPSYGRLHGSPDPGTTGLCRIPGSALRPVPSMPTAPAEHGATAIAGRRKKRSARSCHFLGLQVADVRGTRNGLLLNGHPAVCVEEADTGRLKRDVESKTGRRLPPGQRPSVWRLSAHPGEREKPIEPSERSRVAWVACGVASPAATGEPAGAAGHAPARHPAPFSRPPRPHPGSPAWPRPSSPAAARPQEAPCPACSPLSLLASAMTDTKQGPRPGQAASIGQSRRIG